MANATITLPLIARSRRSRRAFKRHAGFIAQGSTFDEATGELIVIDGDQATVDAALVTYLADQTNIDNDLDASDDAATVGQLQQQFRDDVIINAVVEVFRVQLNDLRSNAGLPDRSEGFIDGRIRNKIANP